MDVCSKIFSSVMNERLFALLGKQGIKFQFSGTPGVGCRDELFTLKTLLNMRQNHDLGPLNICWVRRPCQSVRCIQSQTPHMLLKLYGTPPKLCDAIDRMYKDLVVVLKIGKNVDEIVQEVRMRQGDNMAPVLFHFLMSAFAESLGIVWKQSGINVATVRSVSASDFEPGVGVMKSHKPKQSLSLSLTHCLCNPAAVPVRGRRSPHLHDSRCNDAWHEPHLRVLCSIWLGNALRPRQSCLQN